MGDGSEGRGFGAAVYGGDILVCWIQCDPGIVRDGRGWEVGGGEEECGPGCGDGGWVCADVLDLGLE